MKLSDKYLFRCSESLSLHKYLIKLKTCFFSSIFSCRIHSVGFNLELFFTIVSFQALGGSFTDKIVEGAIYSSCKCGEKQCDESRGSRRYIRIASDLSVFKVLERGRPLLCVSATKVEG